MTENTTTGVKVDQNIRRAKIKKSFDFALHPLDFDRLTLEHGEITTKISDLEGELEDKKKELKGAIDKLTAEMNRLNRLFRHRKETREVESDVLFDFNSGIVSYWHRGQMLEERAMTGDERQVEMGPVLVSTGAPKAQDGEDTVESGD